MQVTSQVFVNSAFRDKVLFPSAASFTVRLANPLRNVTKFVVRDFFCTRPNTAEYMVLYIKQISNFSLSNVSETMNLPSAPYQLSSWTIHLEECYAKNALDPSYSFRYPHCATSALCSDLASSPVATLSQLDLEVWGRPNVLHAAPALVAATPFQLFPFAVLGGEWGCVVEITHDP